MPIATTYSHVNRAKAFYNLPGIYFAIAKSTAWGSPDVPPTPSPSTTDLTEIIGYRKVDSKFYVVPDAISGTISYGDTKWKIVQEANIYTQGAGWIYLETTLLPTELLPLTRYRQIGVYTSLVKAAGVPDTVYALTPAQVSSKGTLEILDNRYDTNRLPDVRDKLSIVIEF